MAKLFGFFIQPVGAITTAVIILSTFSPSIQDPEVNDAVKLFPSIIFPLVSGLFYSWQFKQIPLGPRLTFPIALWPLGLAIGYGLGYFLFRDLFHWFSLEDRYGQLQRPQWGYLFLSNLLTYSLLTFPSIFIIKLLYRSSAR